MFRKSYFTILGNVIVFLFLLVSFGCSAQYSASKDAVQKIKEICPTAEIVEEEVKTGYVEIDFLCNGKRVEAGFNDDNELIFLERETDIPPKVWAKIEKKLNKNYDGWMFDEAAFIETPDTSFYKVEMVKNGVEENVYFSLEGKNYKPFNIIPDEAFSVKTLAGAYREISAPYNFLRPDRIYELPETLREISGIILALDRIMFCVQDEIGAIFKYDLQQENIQDIIRFEDKGDFEDVAIFDNWAYVLRSDGTIFYFNHARFDGKVSQVVAPSGCTDIEGLFFDSTRQVFYMACKSRLVSGHKELRLIYEMKPDKLYETSVALRIDVQEINKMLSEKFPQVTSENSLFQFNPSAVAIHPNTGEMYVLSATDRLLAVFAGNELENVFPLPSDVFYKPEGLAFSKSGDLYISSEGNKSGTISGRILFFPK